MARVLIPQNPRRYNDNPRGSSTTVVTMKSNNPFDGGVAGLRRISNSPGQLAGLGSAGLGADAPIMGPPTPDASAPGAAATSGMNWSAIVGAITPIATSVAPAIGAAAMQQWLPAKAVPIATTGMQMLTPQQQMLMAPKPASKLPYVFVGLGVLGLGVALFLKFRK